MCDNDLLHGGHLVSVGTAQMMQMTLVATLVEVQSCTAGMVRPAVLTLVQIQKGSFDLKTTALELNLVYEAI